MQERTRIILLIIAGIASVVISIFAAMQIKNYFITCEMEAPFACVDSAFVNGTYTMRMANIGEEVFYVTDVSMTREGFTPCIFIKEGMRDTIPPNRALTYIMGLEHPDGKCLIEGMTKGKTYTLSILVNYTMNDQEYVAHGKTRVRYQP
jgi:hypothetical protein